MSDSVDHSGSMIGRYYLQSRIGSGSYGNVYKCLNVLDGKYRAIKILRSNDENLKIWKQEVASQKELSKFPDCNEYVLCMYDSGKYQYKYDMVKQLEQIKLSEDLGKSIEERLRLLENIKGSDINKYPGERFNLKIIKAQLNRIINSKTREILKSQEEYEISKGAEQIRGDYYYIVTELMDGDLEYIIDLIFNKDKKSVEPNINSIEYIIYTLLDGLEYIHSKGMAHMDIKPGNILWKINSDNNQEITLEKCLENSDLAIEYLKIVYGDLGFMCTDDTRYESKENKDLKLCDNKGATPIYLDPYLSRLVLAEYNNINKVELEKTQSDDVWALGVTLWQLIYGEEPPYLEGIETKEALIAKLESLEPGFINIEIEAQGNVPDYIKRLLKDIFNPDGETRIKIEDLNRLMEEYI